MAGKGGGAWKVAYADFVTAMMAFFMVMWLVGQDQEKKAAVAEYFKDPWAKSRMNSNRARNPTLKEAKAGQTKTDKNFDGSNPREVPHEDPEAPDMKQPKLVTVRAPERTTVGTIVTFDVNSSEIDAASMKRLKAIVPRMVGLPNKIEVRGHVAPAMIGTGQDDQMWELSYKRSSIVMKQLMALGVEADRLRIAVAGPHEPLFFDGSKQSQDKNARVEVFLLSETVQKFRAAPPKKADHLVDTHQTTQGEDAHGAPKKPAAPTAHKNVH